MSILILAVIYKHDNHTTTTTTTNNNNNHNDEDNTNDDIKLIMMIMMIIMKMISDEPQPLDSATSQGLSHGIASQGAASPSISDTSQS